MYNILFMFYNYKHYVFFFHQYIYIIILKYTNNEIFSNPDNLNEF